jgi:hypothetical protein
MKGNGNSKNLKQAVSKCRKNSKRLIFVFENQTGARLVCIGGQQKKAHHVLFFREYGEQILGHFYIIVFF